MVPPKSPFKHNRAVVFHEFLVKRKTNHVLHWRKKHHHLRLLTTLKRSFVFMIINDAGGDPVAFCLYEKKPLIVKVILRYRGVIT